MSDEERNEDTSSSDSSTNVVSQQAQEDAALAAKISAMIDDKIADAALAVSQESWIKSYWRPAMGWLYMVICAFDFVIFPLLSMMSPVIYKIFGIEAVYIAWASLTLSNGGMVHMAFGTILGVAAWTRSKEKLLSMTSPGGSS